MAALLAPASADPGTLADTLLTRFSTLAGVLSADPSSVTAVSGERAAAWIALISTGMQHALAAQAFDGPVITSSGELARYLRFAQGSAQVEVVRVLYLTARHQLICDEIASRGTIDEAVLYVREVLARALELGAAAIILVHNHPSGDPKPSKADVEMTRRLALTGKGLGIQLLDHLIVARAEMLSFRAQGLL
ncbi:JAB domain-containing protein [Sphingomonas koreensis]|uniref:JAB domain-containing protein n=1 Tax=Sphingomonas koreensis TaxID=93064 RepID=UPI001F497250|nr:DNA repair protein RadC [Sphingomonas koreensis]